MNQALRAAVEQALSRTILSERSLAGGCINAVSRLELEDGSSAVLKHSASAPTGMFSQEAAGLELLARAGCLRVPSVLYISNDFLLIEYLEPSRERNWFSLGQGLAKQHRATAAQFGSVPDNFIGSSPQRNCSHDSWADFFLSERLGVQRELAHKAGWWDARVEDAFQAALPRMRELLAADPSPPSLLHGDLWGGNVYWSDDGPALIDPAVYYGSREADLAFTEMFGPFSSAFYQGYNAEWPLDSGYSSRRMILNLYHLMNHATLFRGPYVADVATTLARYRR